MINFDRSFSLSRSKSEVCHDKQIKRTKMTPYVPAYLFSLYKQNYNSDLKRRIDLKHLISLNDYCMWLPPSSFIWCWWKLALEKFKYDSIQHAIGTLLFVPFFQKHILKVSNWSISQSIDRYSIQPLLTQTTEQIIILLFRHF